MEKLIITPKTKIYDLLEAYPQLEDVLIDIAPEFKKLKNPILRKTIARVTNISQAAVVGNVAVDKVVSRLRKEVGQDGVAVSDEETTKYLIVEPEWFHLRHVVGFINIGEILNRGEQPVHEVLGLLKKLGEEEILEVAAPFVPAPLIDKALGLGYLHYLKPQDDGYRVFFVRE